MAVEDGIAQMLKQKKGLAIAVLSHGEAALTELSDAEPAELVTMRHSTTPWSTAEPEWLWRSREIAELLGDVTLVATYRQLARWTEKGLIKRVRRDATRRSHRKRRPLRELQKR
ncbi:hypothetical protein [Streptomyces sp. NPDC048191]|uniref:hypothetical protein n=1 Tax=Streptomyces sp. NPDC048191 TaxID=3155484 RepID=UPI0033FEC527